MLPHIIVPLFFLVTLVSVGAVPPLPSGFLSCDVSDNGDYAVYIDVDGTEGPARHNLWLQGKETFVTLEGKRVDNTSGLNLTFVLRATGHDSLGMYNMTEVHYEALGHPLVMSVRQYKSDDVLVFKQSFPEGLVGTSTGNVNGVSSSFPAFSPATIPGVRRGWAQYDGWDCDGKHGTCMKQSVASAGHVAYGEWSNATSQLPDGLEGTGPLAIFATDMSATIVASAFSGIMALSQSFDHEARALRYGVMGSVEQFPQGWSVEVILAAGRGPTEALRRWGHKMVTAYQKDPAANGDFISTHLGYDTDNGAFYYYHPETNKSYADTLIDVKKYADTVGIPYRHVQIDSWWYIKGQGGGTKSWSPGANTFPQGVAKFREQTGWPITAHNRMWANDVVYASQNGGNWSGWLLGGDSSLPTNSSFWKWLLQDAKSWGLQMYEQDWLYTEFIGVGGAMLKNATLGRTWMLQMNEAAHPLGLGIQLCMAWPRHVLQSLEMPAVTQARGSPDYNVHSEQWRIGDNALFLEPLGLRTTKDCFRSNATSGEMFPELQAAVSSLSTGPVYPCDEIGTSDVALIMKCCRIDGKLLQTSRAAAPIDASIAAKAGVGQNISGELWRADSFIGSDEQAVWHFPMLLTADFSGYDLSFHELLDDGEEPPQSFVAVSHRSPSKVWVLSQKSKLQLNSTTKSYFEVWSFAPVLSTGWALLGEQAKWVPVSPQRFVSISTLHGLTAKVSGAAKEGVAVTLLPPNSSSPTTIHCVLSSTGNAILRAASQTCEPLDDGLVYV